MYTCSNTHVERHGRMPMESLRPILKSIMCPGMVNAQVHAGVLVSYEHNCIPAYLYMSICVNTCMNVCTVCANVCYYCAHMYSNVCTCVHDAMHVD